MSDKFENSLKSGPHSLLQKLIGNWEGQNSLWFEPSKLADSSPVKGSISSILGGRFLQYQYKSFVAEQELEGLAIIGFDLNLERFQISWMDTFHNGTAIMASNSERKSNEINVLGSYIYIAPDAEHQWGWRTIIDLKNDNELIITAFNIMPDGTELKATESKLKRV